MPKKYLQNFRNLLLKKEENVSDIEMTKGNYDEKSSLIKTSIPTITTEFCEIGNYNNIIYLVFIIHSDTYNKELFSLIKKLHSVKIYGFKNFKETLYPIPDFSYKNFEKKIKEDKYLQIQFNFDINITQEKLLKEYLKLKEIFTKSNIVVVNQLKIENIL